MIAEGRLFALVTDGETQSALALDAKDGKELWQVPLSPHIEGFMAPASTPAVDSGRVFCSSPGTT